MYVGSTKSVEQEMFVYDDEQKQMIKKKIKFVPGLYKLYDEGIVNMRDHHVRMRDMIAEQELIVSGQHPNNSKIEMGRKYRPVKTIEINVDLANDLITLKNDGDGIDVAFHNTEKVYVPELIFGNLLTGTNFDSNERRTVRGQNGYGAKLINILSTEFILETVDASRGLKYTQRFTNNMSAREEPVIAKYKGLPYTQLSFKPDFKRFGLAKLSDDDTVLLMRKRAYDLAACTSKDVTVWYNNEKLEVKTFERYIDLYIGARGENKRIYTVVNPDWEIAVCVSPDNNFEHVSFINGICTYRGGKHVDHASNIIASRLAKYSTDNKKGMTGITPKSIKDNMWLFINSTMVNPSFDTQTKENFTTNITDFRNRCDVDDDFIAKLAQPKLGLLEKAVRLSEFKAGKGLKKSDGKKAKRVKLHKLQDAPYAGKGKKSLKCALILTEGDSATTSAAAGLAGLKDEERKYYGYMPLRGKIINPKDSKLETIENNKEFSDLKKVIGLKQGADYSAPNAIESLRYGRVILMTDADVDGDHIKGLGFNLFHEFWPSLLKIEGFFCSLLTPIMKVIHKTNGKKISFYSLSEYNQWKDENQLSINMWETRYYKGLGSSKSNEAKEFFTKMKLQAYSWDDLSRMLAKNALNATVDPVPDVVNPALAPAPDVVTVIPVEQHPEFDTISQYSDVSMMTNIESFKNYYSNSKRHPCDLAIELAFSKKNADYRKGWITNYLKLKADDKIDLGLQDLKTMSYYDFINEKLIDFSVYDNERSIPSIADGLKPSQRKVIYTVLTKAFKTNIKVSELGGLVATKTSYHHGDTSMVETIVGLAQDFPGSNNINMLLPEGQFGSRKGISKSKNQGQGKQRWDW
jgi:DNA topoisomerase-2